MKNRLLFLLILIWIPLAGVPTTQLEKNIWNQVNEHRRSQGKADLKLDPIISNICRKHAEEMAACTAPFSHDRFHDRFEQVKRLIPRTTAAAENIAWNMGYPKPDCTAVTGWIESPSHHKAMVGDYTLTGVGAAKSPDNRYYFNQIFVKSKGR